MTPCESNKPELIQKPNQQQRALEEENKKQQVRQKKKTSHNLAGHLFAVIETAEMSAHKVATACLLKIAADARTTCLSLA